MDGSQNYAEQSNESAAKVDYVSKEYNADTATAMGDCGDTLAGTGDGLNFLGSVEGSATPERSRTSTAFSGKPAKAENSPRKRSRSLRNLFSFTMSKNQISPPVPAFPDLIFSPSSGYDTTASPSPSNSTVSSTLASPASAPSPVPISLGSENKGSQPQDALLRRSRELLPEFKVHRLSLGLSVFDAKFQEQTEHSIFIYSPCDPLAEQQQPKLAFPLDHVVNTGESRQSTRVDNDAYGSDGEPDSINDADDYGRPSLEVPPGVVKRPKSPTSREKSLSISLAQSKPIPTSHSISRHSPPTDSVGSLLRGAKTCLYLTISRLKPEVGKQSESSKTGFAYPTSIVRLAFPPSSESGQGGQQRTLAINLHRLAIVRKLQNYKLTLMEQIELDAFRKFPTNAPSPTTLTALAKTVIASNTIAGLGEDRLTVNTSKSSEGQAGSELRERAWKAWAMRPHFSERKELLTPRGVEVVYEPGRPIQEIQISKRARCLAGHCASAVYSEQSVATVAPWEGPFPEVTVTTPVPDFMEQSLPPASSAIDEAIKTREAQYQVLVAKANFQALPSQKPLSLESPRRPGLSRHKRRSLVHPALLRPGGQPSHVRPLSLTSNTSSQPSDKYDRLLPTKQLSQSTPTRADSNIIIDGNGWLDDDDEKPLALFTVNSQQSHSAEAARITFASDRPGQVRPSSVLLRPPSSSLQQSTSDSEVLHLHAEIAAPKAERVRVGELQKEVERMKGAEAMRVKAEHVRALEREKQANKDREELEIRKKTVRCFVLRQRSEADLRPAVSARKSASDGKNIVVGPLFPCASLTETLEDTPPCHSPLPCLLLSTARDCPT